MLEFVHDYSYLNDGSPTRRTKNPSLTSSVPPPTASNQSGAETGDRARETTSKMKRKVMKSRSAVWDLLVCKNTSTIIITRNFFCDPKKWHYFT